MLGNGALFAALCSGKVNENGAVVVIALHILISNQHLDLLLDHLGVGLEHRNVADDVVDQHLEAVCLLCLHYLDSVGLDDELTLAGDLLSLCGLFRCRLRRLLLDDLLWDETDTDRV